MLADSSDFSTHAGNLNKETHLSGGWVDSLIEFLINILPSWRDDPKRPAKENENSLSAQLCAHLNSVSRTTTGWDFLQFRREEPEESDARRAIDIAVAPSGTLIWLQGQHYNEYQTLLPIECKRLPTPIGKDRDEREYLYSCQSTTGGIQRFRAGHHAARQPRAAMIGYIQEHSILSWASQIDAWVEELEKNKVEGWSAADKFFIVKQVSASRTALLRSEHTRSKNLGRIKIDHLWIEM